MSVDVLDTPELDLKVRDEPHRMTDNSGCQRELARLKEEIVRLRVSLGYMDRLHRRQFYHQEDTHG